jgi:hypothetical protein
MTDPKTQLARSGRLLTDEDVDAIATEVEETDYDVEALKGRRRGWPFHPAFIRRPKSGELLTGRLSSDASRTGVSRSLEVT